MSGINWSILAYAGVFLIGVGVIVIAIAVFMTLSKIRKTLVLVEEIGREFATIADDAVKLANDLNGTVKKVEKNLEPIMHESNLLLHNTNILAEDIQEKSKKLDPVFNSTDSIVATVTAINDSLINMKNNAVNLVGSTNDKIVDLKAKADGRLSGLKENVDKFKKIVKKEDSLELTTEEQNRDKLTKIVETSKKGVGKVNELIQKVVNKESNSDNTKEEKLANLVSKSKNSVEKASQLINKYFKK